MDSVPGTVLGAGDVTGKPLTVWSSHPCGGRQSKALRKSDDFRSGKYPEENKLGRSDGGCQGGGTAFGRVAAEALSEV